MPAGNGIHHLDEVWDEAEGCHHHETVARLGPQDGRSGEQGRSAGGCTQEFTAAGHGNAPEVLTNSPRLSYK